MHAIDRSKNQKKATDRKQNEYDITNLLSFIYSRYKTEKVTSKTHFSREEVTWNTGNHTYPFLG